MTCYHLSNMGVCCLPREERLPSSGLSSCVESQDAQPIVSKPCSPAAAEGAVQGTHWHPYSQPFSQSLSTEGCCLVPFHPSTGAWGFSSPLLGTLAVFGWLPARSAKAQVSRSLVHPAPVFSHPALQEVLGDAQLGSCY